MLAECLAYKCAVISKGNSTENQIKEKQKYTHALPQRADGSEDRENVKHHTECRMLSNGIQPYANEKEKENERKSRKKKHEANLYIKNADNKNHK